MASLLSEIQQPSHTTVTPAPLTHHIQHGMSDSRVSYWHTFVFGLIDSSVREWVNEFAPAPPTPMTSSIKQHHQQSDTWAQEYTNQTDKAAHDWSVQFEYQRKHFSHAIKKISCYTGVNNLHHLKMKNGDFKICMYIHPHNNFCGYVV